MKKGVTAVLAVIALAGIMLACTACSDRSTASADRGNVNELNGNTKGAREETTALDGIIDENEDVTNNDIEDESEYADDEGIGEKVSDAAHETGEAVKDTADDVKNSLAEDETRAREVG